MPNSCIGRNARTFLSRKQWDMIRKWCYRHAGYQCEYCGAMKTRVECHEEWDFIMVQEHRIQRLIGLKCLCGDCHHATHLYQYGSLRSQPRYRKHLREVNGWSKIEFKRALRLARREYRKRSEWQWELDLMWIVDHFGLPNIVIHHPPYEVEVNFDVECE